MTPLPLAGVRVIEFCNVAAGPFCGMLLADMGADVVKVEQPEGGDTLRSWPPINRRLQRELRLAQPQQALGHAQPQGPGRRATCARALVREADVVIENNRPGVMDRLGLGYDALRALNPALVYCSISAYGQTGPARAGGRLRPDHPGDERHHERDRRARRRRR